jgi:hypothetical protein
MLQLIGIPLIAAAWAIPALFVLTLAFLFSLAVFRPLFLAWSYAWDAAAGWVNREVQAMAKWVLSRTYVHAVQHTRPE